MRAPALAGMIAPPALMPRIGEPTGSIPIKAAIKPPGIRKRIVIRAESPGRRRRKVGGAVPTGIDVTSAIDDGRAVDVCAGVAGQVAEGDVVDVIVVDVHVAH